MLFSHIGRLSLLLEDPFFQFIQKDAKDVIVPYTKLAEFLPVHQYRVAISCRE